MISSIYTSFRSLPLWVQVWMVVILMPVNAGGLLFLDQPIGLGIAVLGLAGMLLNIPVLMYSRGFSKLMAVPHLLPWTALVAWLLYLIFTAGVPEGNIRILVGLILVVDVISLAFDYKDSIEWFRGDRAVAGLSN